MLSTICTLAFSCCDCASVNGNISAKFFATITSTSDTRAASSCSVNCSPVDNNIARFSVGSTSNRGTGEAFCIELALTIDGECFVFWNVYAGIFICAFYNVLAFENDCGVAFASDAWFWFYISGVRIIVGEILERYCGTIGYGYFCF